MKAGVCKRIATKLPEFDPNELRKLQKFTARWVRQNLQPLSADIDLSFETWLAKTNYTESRKASLREKWNKNPDMDDRKYHACKCFMKDETYTEYKHARGIFSRTDEWKCYYGPYIKAIEEQVYKLPWFIKHVPVADRPQYVMDFLYRADAIYSATDYTAYESSFRKEIMNAVSFELYRYTMKNVPTFPNFLKMMSVISGKNECYFKNFSFTVEATRMSGEMDTSLANGFTNLMVFLYLCKKKKCGEVKMVVEGDDGLASTASNTFPTSEDFASLGFDIKLELHSTIETASFCGIVFDAKDKINVTNPLEAIYTVGWLPERYKNARESLKLSLLRCKAFSLAYQYPGCPIISEYAQYILRFTRKYHAGSLNLLKKNVFNSYERDLYLKAVSCESKAPKKDTGIGTRILVANLYGISVSDQLEIERFLREKQSLDPFQLGVLDKYVPDTWKQYYDQYGVVSREVDRPPITLARNLELMKFIVDGKEICGDIDDVY